MSLTVSASGITFNDLTTLSTSVLSTANIANNSITTAKIVPGAVITEDLANGAVTAAKLAPGILSAQAALKTDTQVGSTVAGTETDITGLSLLFRQQLQRFFFWDTSPLLVRMPVSV